jgi:hypothetical protein
VFAQENYGTSTRWKAALHNNSPTMYICFTKLSISSSRENFLNSIKLSINLRKNAQILNLRAFTGLIRIEIAPIIRFQGYFFGLTTAFFKQKNTPYNHYSLSNFLMGTYGTS